MGEDVFTLRRPLFGLSDVAFDGEVHAWWVTDIQRVSLDNVAGRMGPPPSLRRRHSLLPAPSPPQHRLQKFPGIAPPRLDDLLPRGGGDHLPAALVPLLAQVGD